MCHLTEMKHTTIHFLNFTQLTSQNTSKERSGSVVERLTSDREVVVRASPASLRCGP